MAAADLNEPAQSPVRGTSSCVAPGFNPGRAYETNHGCEFELLYELPTHRFERAMAQWADAKNPPPPKSSLDIAPKPNRHTRRKSAIYSSTPEKPSPTHNANGFSFVFDVALVEFFLPTQFLAHIEHDEPSVGQG